MRTPNPEQARELRDYFLEINYVEDRFRKEFESVNAPTGLDPTRPDSLHRTSGATPWNALVRLFYLGVGLPESHYRVLPPRIQELCLELELVEAGTEFVPTCLLYPFRDCWIAADRYPSESDTPRFDHVLTAGPVARHLSYFVACEFLRDPTTARVLDLCTGGGVHAVRLAQSATSVVGTDLNPRALRFAGFNAALAGTETVVFREGDGLRPVVGEMFDLIVCNPPFILTPSREWISSDSPGELDGFCETLIRAIPEHLVPNGRLQMILEWAELEGEDWRNRLAGWVEGLGCDAWFIHANQESPASYTRHRIGEQAALKPPGQDPPNEEIWHAYYAEHKVRAIHGGFLLLRKRDGRNWTRFSEISGSLTPETGQEVERTLLHFDRIEQLGTGQTGERDPLLERRLQLRDGVQREERSESKNGLWVRSVTRLHSDGGLPQEVHVDPAMADLLGCFLGTETVSEVIQSFADSRGATRDQVESECLRIIHHFLERRWLIF